MKYIVTLLVIIAFIGEETYAQDELGQFINDAWTCDNGNSTTAISVEPMSLYLRLPVKTMGERVLKLRVYGADHDQVVIDTQGAWDTITVAYRNLPSILGVDYMISAQMYDGSQWVTPTVSAYNLMAWNDRPDSVWMSYPIETLGSNLVVGFQASDLNLLVGSPNSAGCFEHSVFLVTGIDTGTDTVLVGEVDLTLEDLGPHGMVYTYLGGDTLSGCLVAWMERRDMSTDPVFEPVKFQTSYTFIPVCGVQVYGTTVGINNTVVTKGPTVWPNPARGQANVRLDGPAVLFDLTGRIVMNINETDQVIDLSGLVSGTYVLRDMSGTTRLVVE